MRDLPVHLRALVRRWGRVEFVHSCELGEVGGQVEVGYEGRDRSWSLRVATADVFDDGGEGLYGEFVYAVEVARALHDPGYEWEAFRDTLWEFLVRVFGLETAEAWPAGLPGAGEVPAGDARAVAGWLRELDGDVQRPGATPRS